MIRDDDPVRAVREAARRVLARHDAFDEHLHRRRVLELIDVVPGEARDAHVHGSNVDPIEHVLRAVRRLDAGLMAREAERVMVAVEARDRLEVARGQVDRERERRAAGPLRALDHALRHVPVARRVELEPDRRAARLAHVLDRVVGDSRQHLERVLRFRRARDRDFAVGMKRLLRADGAEQDRRRVALAEELDGHVDVRDVDEPLRSELDLLEPFAVRRDRAEVVGALRHVRVVVRADGVAHYGLEVEDVQRLFRALDEAGPLECATEHRVVLRGEAALLRRELAQRQRARERVRERALREESQESAPRARRVGAHDDAAPGLRPGKHSTFEARCGGG